MAYPQLDFYRRRQHVDIPFHCLFKGQFVRRIVIALRREHRRCLEINHGVSALRSAKTRPVVAATRCIAGRQHIHGHILSADVAMSDVVLVKEGNRLQVF